MRIRPLLAVVLVAAVSGLTFSAISTYDFAQHLDRQVHDVHCSFLPGAAPDAGSGCKVTMMSAYSSVFRSRIWGGVPVALPAMAVFAFLLGLALDLQLRGADRDRRATGFLALATGLPAATSVVFAYLSLFRLGAACKLCIGIYISSALCLVAAILLWRRAGQSPGAVKTEPAPVKAVSSEEGPGWAGGRPAGAAPARASRADSAVGLDSAQTKTSTAYLAGAFAIGVALVLVPVLTWAKAAPDHARFIGTCGMLERSDDPYGVMISLGGSPGGVPALEILDPLCPACSAFERRLGSDLASQMSRQAILFPLDSTCNWMVDRPMHPGACTVSEAVLCAGEKAENVVRWAFAQQEELLAAAAKDPEAVTRMVRAEFPALASCIGSAEVKSKLNKSLRWAVQNRLSVLTPQLYVAGVKLCDEDVDIGLDYALSRMLDRHRAGTLPKPSPPPAPVARPLVAAAGGPAPAVAVDGAARPVATTPSVAADVPATTGRDAGAPVAPASAGSTATPLPLAPPPPAPAPAPGSPAPAAVEPPPPPTPPEPAPAPASPAPATPAPGGTP